MKLSRTYIGMVERYINSRRQGCLLECDGIAIANNSISLILFSPVLNDDGSGISPVDFTGIEVTLYPHFKNKIAGTSADFLKPPDVRPCTSENVRQAAPAFIIAERPQIRAAVAHFEARKRKRLDLRRLAFATARAFPFPVCSCFTHSGVYDSKSARRVQLA